MALLNPYLDCFHALPPACRRDPAAPLSSAELLAPDWLALKAAIAGHFAWAVPTDEAIAAIARCASRVLEIGAGSGYWAWMMQQAGIAVAAFDSAPPRFTWHEVTHGDARTAALYPDHALLLCWPPWNSDMAFQALTAYRGGHVIFVGEWMGGCADPYFFATLAATYDVIDAVDIPQWHNRNDRLLIFRRRRAIRR